MNGPIDLFVHQNLSDAGFAEFVARSIDGNGFQTRLQLANRRLALSRGLVGDCLQIGANHAPPERAVLRILLQVLGAHVGQGVAGNLQRLLRLLAAAMSEGQKHAQIGREAFLQVGIAVVVDQPFPILIRFFPLVALRQESPEGKPQRQATGLLQASAKRRRPEFVGRQSRAQHSRVGAKRQAGHEPRQSRHGFRVGVMIVFQSEVKSGPFRKTAQHLFDRGKRQM